MSPADSVYHIEISSGLLTGRKLDESMIIGRVLPDMLKAICFES